MRGICSRGLCGASEYWISGEDYLWVSTVPGMPELWHLYVDGMSLSAEMADGDLDWQTGDDSGLYLTFWVPPIDLGDYDVKSVVTQGDRQWVTEYSEVTEGEVDAYLQELYLEAAG